MLKSIVTYIISIVFHPAEAWKNIDSEGYGKNIHLTYVLPLILSGTVAAVIGQLWAKPFALQNIIKVVAVSFISAYTAYFLSLLIIRYYIKKRYGNNATWNNVSHFTGYASTILFILNIVLGLFPVDDLFFLKILSLYTFFIVAQGSFTLNIKENEQTSFILVAASVIVLCPIVINMLIKFLMPGMKI